MERSQSSFELILIRKDNPVDYGDGVSKQDSHYNADRTGGKLKQHHNYRDGKEKKWTHCALAQVEDTICFIIHK
jgi:hypothetical protein